ncbi:MAG: excinuclease ABC subunit UvrA [Candidatus Ranarchaeia archaeon]
MNEPFEKKYLVVKGAKEHNLRNIDVKIPRNTLTVITGVSGSGKSSLAFDTIYAEGQRRYVESLSAYARQFLGMMEKPDVEFIEGLSPAISIQQKSVSKNPRSTVGTITEVHDYLRLLYSRAGDPHCPECGKPIRKQSPQEIVDQIMNYKENTKIMILAPIVIERKGEYHKLFSDLYKQGILKAEIDGEIKSLKEPIRLEKQIKHTISAIIDRIKISKNKKGRLNESIELSLKLANGLVKIKNLDTGLEKIFSESLACVDCGYNLSELEPRAFSFNSPFGACPDCKGLGILMELDPELILDKDKTLREGGIMKRNLTTKSWSLRWWTAFAKHYNFSLDTPLKEVPEDVRNKMLYGTGDETIPWQAASASSEWFYESNKPYGGLIKTLKRRFSETKSEYSRDFYLTFMSQSKCPTCNGRRLKRESLAVTVEGVAIDEILSWSIHKTLNWIKKIKRTLSEKKTIIAKEILKEIRKRLEFLLNVGLDYLTLDRPATSLSGGESQRIHLATQIGSQLVGVLYVLDEPSIGLHARDKHKLLSTLEELRDIGNTVLIVEHDEDTIRLADHVIDLGPRAGKQGGKVVIEGTLEDVIACEKSLTGQYLSGKKNIPLPKSRRIGTGKNIVVREARTNNLKGIDVEFPLGTLICVTGVSGSGKSSLIEETLHKGISRKLHRSNVKPGPHKSIEGLENIDKIIAITQSPIGRTPRSNPATYTKVWDPIRKLFSKTEEARMRGWQQGRFSFNVKGGRCEACRGAGSIRVEMNFLPDVSVPCEVCKGKRFNQETLEVGYKGKNIYEILRMTVDEGLKFFQNIPEVMRILQTLHNVGLGYIQLGQPATTLSGGEAQRIKLARELAKRSTGKTLFLLDEPTTGLHFHDIKYLLKVLNSLVEKNNTVIVIEHNMDIIKSADHIIDLGPEGGDKGGKIIGTGTPEEITQNQKSYTGQYLKEQKLV